MLWFLGVVSLLNAVLELLIQGYFQSWKQRLLVLNESYVILVVFRLSFLPQIQDLVPVAQQARVVQTLAIAFVGLTYQVSDLRLLGHHGLLEVIYELRVLVLVNVAVAAGAADRQRAVKRR